MLLGSFISELEGVSKAAAAGDALRLRSIDDDDARTAARQSSNPLVTARPPTDCWGELRALELPQGAPRAAPTRSAALALLSALAADVAVVAAMRRRGWRVLLLSEMPPQGRVGVSPVCLLGYNVNRGAEIALRLRTDDWAGFRKYLRVRETLVHELAHMQHDDHDAAFKELNSQLLREIAAHDAQAGRAHVLVPGAVDDDRTDGKASWRSPPLQVQRGNKLGGSGGAGDPLAAGAAAAAAALKRWQLSRQDGVQGGSSATATAHGGDSTSRSSSSSSGVDAGKGGGAVDDDTFTTEPSTAAAEAAMRALGAELEAPRQKQHQDKMQ